MKTASVRRGWPGAAAKARERPEKTAARDRETLVEEEAGWRGSSGGRAPTRE